MTNYSFLLNRYCGVGTNQKEAQWFKEINAAIMHWAGAFIVADYIPYLKWVTKLQGVTASLQRLRIFKYSTILYDSLFQKNWEELTLHVGCAKY